VVAWLGYDTPLTLSLGAITDGPAVTAAEHLRSLVTALHGLNGAQISLLCHSYGSRVCAIASASEGLPVSDLAAYGSHDMGVSTAAELDTDARVWAGRGTADWVRYLPGPDPVSPRFGARHFSAGDAGHSDYLTPGSVSLRNLALIALGRADAVG
jgi:alpha/beta hydrolase family protein